MKRIKKRETKYTSKRVRRKDMKKYEVCYEVIQINEFLNNVKPTITKTSDVGVLQFRTHKFDYMLFLNMQIDRVLHFCFFNVW
jgi:hypothetical protein